MAVDLAVLGIKVDATGAIITVKEFGAAADGAAKQTDKLEQLTGKLKSGLAALGIGFGVAAAVHKFVQETTAAQNAVAQLEARLKSTGNVAGQSSQGLQDFAKQMQGVTTFSDEAVMGVEALILTFTRIRGDVVQDATRAVLDMATAMGTDTKGAAIQLGKALNDPVEGISALTRVGVTFSAEQKQVIKTLVETGKQAEAQRLILAELETEFGGSARAARDTFGGALAGLKNQWGELFEVSKGSSGQMIQAINGISAALGPVRDGFEAFIGGIRLIYVDVVNLIQQGNAKIYAGAAAVLQAIAGGMSLIPGLGTAAGVLTAKAVELRTEAETLSAAFAAWKVEQYSVITGTGVAAQQTRFMAVAAGELAENLTRVATAGAQARAALPGLQGGGVGSAPGALSLTSTVGTNAARHEAAIKKQLIRDLSEYERQQIVEQVTEEARIRENFLRQWQQTFSNGIVDLLTNGLSSFKSFFASVTELGVRALGDIFAKNVMEGPLSGILGSIGTSGGNAKASGAFGLSANHLAGIAGVGLAIGGFVSNLQAQADHARAAQVAFENHRVEWARSLDAFAAQLADTTAFEKAKAAQKTQAEALASNLIAAANQALQANKATWNLGTGNRDATPTIGSGADLAATIATLQRSQGSGKNVAQDRVLAETLDELQKLYAQYQANTEALKQQVAEQEALATQDLDLRRLQREGRTEEYEALKAQLQFEEELRVAREKGFSQEYLDALQAEQTATYAAAQAARENAAAQQAQADAARQAADTLRELVEAMQNQEALQVRLLRAQGKGDEADQAAFDFAQRQERERAAIDHWSDDLMAMLLEVQKAERERRAAEIAKQGEAAGGTSGALVGGATPSSSGSIVRADFGSRVSATVGDRMLDALVGSRLILRQIEINTRGLRNLGGAIDTHLGLSYGDANAYAGSAVVS